MNFNLAVDIHHQLQYREIEETAPIVRITTIKPRSIVNLEVNVREQLSGSP